MKKPLLKHAIGEIKNALQFSAENYADEAAETSSKNLQLHYTKRASEQQAILSLLNAGKIVITYQE